MIPAGDHSTRSLVHRRVSSWMSWSEEGAALLRDDVDSDSSSAEVLSRPLLPQLEYEEEEEEDLVSVVSRTIGRQNWKLSIVFLLLIVSGVSNVVLAKLQSLPMYNYPTFLNIYANFLYVVLSFLYILPVCYFGWFHRSISRAQLTSMSKRPFLIMGALDAIAGAMQVLSTIYLPGTLLVLLPQAAIPLSMLASRLVLREKFTQYQYLGAAIVFAGILVVLFPVLTQQNAPEFSCQALDVDQNCMICEQETKQEDCESHRRSNRTTFQNNVVDKNDDFDCEWVSKHESMREYDFLKFVWSLVMLASMVPMVASTVYKQVALQVQLDPIFVNGWVSLFQFLSGILLVVPAGYASSPRVRPVDLPQNWAQATECLFAQNDSITFGCHPDNCSQAALWVHLGLLSSVVYTISLILVLKYGSASLLYLGLTLMVPLGHLVFSLHDSSDTRMADVAGLIVLVAGLVLFRFGHNKEVEVSAEQDIGDVIAPDPQNEVDSNASLDFNVTTYVTVENRQGEHKNGFLEFLREPFLLVGDI